MSHSQSQQIKIGQLAGAVNPITGKDRLVTKGNCIPPEFMIARNGKLTQLRDQVARSELYLLTISGIRQDSDCAVFRDGAARPAVLFVRQPPCMGSFVKSMVGIKQSDDHIDV